MRTVSVIPAYGRDYKSKTDLLADWRAGKDFRLQDVAFGDSYFSIRNAASLQEDGVTHLNIHYNNLLSVIVVAL